ncbi:DUF1501 domain-containing protein [Arenimonas donghaensis]|uniref:DUF1501 domain-containing protein n=1 Tax=Arenimonas donghaensis DSM 18148 = HO3-R19 TaxID=1121014 RepID=A0A087MFK5_9GAMM|nr:DUF1501 domain-containing protein [Arenimonas donghaensis]KFL35658.1 hypothetical protein N788_07940 [Arenimonas donghaensis DSM 18148 = HO3-R19]
MRIDRRRFLGALAATACVGACPGLTFAAGPGPDARRLVVLLLRGGLDGLHAVPAYADPAWQRLRGKFELELPAATRLDGLFALHPALAFSRELYGRGQLLPVLGVAPPYQGRSHFDAQDCLENGGRKPGEHRDGWLNRCAGALAGSEALAIASVTPLIFRGPQPVANWWPGLPREVSPALMQRLAPLYARDPVLAGAYETAMAAAEEGMDPMDVRAGRQSRLPMLMAHAGRVMAEPQGPRLAFVEDTGWDSHGNQANQLQRKLAELDAALKAFHDAAGARWADTAVVVVTEFGRTAAINGTRGTDHGTGSHAFLAGGAVQGGRIAGQWPGLAPADLNEGRDLRAGTDLRALFKGVLASHLGLSEAVLAEQVFPGSAGLAPMEDLLRARPA